MWRSLSAAFLFLAGAASAATISRNVDITITHSTGWGSESALGANYGVIRASGSTLHAVYGDASGGEIHYRQSTDEGTTWTSDRRIALNAALNPTDALAISGANLAVAYISGGDIWLIHSGNAGLTWDASCKLTSQGNVYRLSMDASGPRFDLVYSLNGSNGGAIFYIGNPNNGVCGSWGTPKDISGGSNTAVRPRIASFGSLVHVVWESQDGGRPPCYQFASCPDGFYVRSTNGASFEAPQHIITYNPVTMAIIPRPEIVVLPSSGNPVVTYHQADPGDAGDANQQIYSITSSSQGSAGSWGPQVPVTGIPLNDSHPQAAAAGNIAYQQWSNTDLSTQFTTPYFSMSDGGANWTPSEQVSAQNTYADALAVTANYIHAVYSPFSGGPLYYRRRAR